MTVESQGTGRVDYSQNAEYLTVPIIRSHQERSSTTITALCYSFDYGYVYAVRFLTHTVDLVKRHIADISMYVAGDFLIYLDLTQYLAGAVTATVGSVIGYKKAVMNFTKGFVWDPEAGYDYDLYFNVLMDRPYPSHWPADTYTAIIDAHGFYDKAPG